MVEKGHVRWVFWALGLEMSQSLGTSKDELPIGALQAALTLNRIRHLVVEAAQKGKILKIGALSPCQSPLESP